jgi:hypothetical protein
MTRAPYITNNTLSRRRHHLRTNHYELIRLSTRQELLTPTKYRAYRPNAGTADPVLSLMEPLRPICQIGYEALVSIKSL